MDEELKRQLTKLTESLVKLNDIEKQLDQLRPHPKEQWTQEQWNDALRIGQELIKEAEQLGAPGPIVQMVRDMLPMIQQHTKTTEWTEYAPV